MEITCISDLHGNYPELEGGDLLIVAGDLTARDTALEHLDFLEWLKHQPYEEKIVIAGNHDNFIQNLKSKYIAEVQTLSSGMKYLLDSGTEFQGLKIWGSPWTLAFEGINPKCKAFTCETEEELDSKFSLIPDDTDILITHGPPIYIRDCVDDYLYGKREHVGSVSLGNKCRGLKHKLHVFGHIHEGYGTDELTRISDGSQLTCVNCSHVNERYKPVNKPVRVIL